MSDFNAARRMMVDGQLRTFDITDQDVLAAMLAVPRERFVPAASAGIAYLDTEIPVGGHGGRRLLQPMIFGKMLQAAEIARTDRVLDVGCATGYSSAVLARLCAHVTALEEDPELVRQARQLLFDSGATTGGAIGATPVAIVEGPLAYGWPHDKPYDVIVVNGRCETVPAELLGQLGTNGRLVAIVGSGPAPKATIYRNADGKISGRPIFDASGPVLPGFTRPLAFQF
jgi:protein-L-isoaspartate(D-aspartate) O-methyltransferase